MLDEFGVFVKNDIGEIAPSSRIMFNGFFGAAEKQCLLNAPVSFFNCLSFPCKYANTSGSNRSGCMVFVEKMLQLLQRTSAPKATNVSINTAV